MQNNINSRPILFVVLWGAAVYTSLTVPKDFQRFWFCLIFWGFFFSHESPLYRCHAQITVKLDLRNNNLQELPRGAFTHTPYLTHLNLQRCNINRVKEGAFRALGRVVSLNLAYNKIDILLQVSTYLTGTESLMFHFLI